jgi:hypothetical protein
MYGAAHCDEPQFRHKNALVFFKRSVKLYGIQDDKCFLQGVKKVPAKTFCSQFPGSGVAGATLHFLALGNTAESVRR